MGLLLQTIDEGLESACGEAPGWLCRQVYERTSNEILAGAADWLIQRPAKILLIVVLAWVVNRLVRRAIRRFTARVANPEVPTLGAKLHRYTPAVLMPTGETNVRSAARAETLGSVLRSVSTAIIWTIAALLILGELGISLGPLLAGAGIAGIALGFGAQTVVKDFLSGLFMLIEDQYGLGDVVDAGAAVGVVEGISLRTTRLRGLDGTLWHVPNGEIARVGNLTQQWSRTLLDVEVAYRADLDHARAVILGVAEEMYQDPEWAAKILEPPEIWGVERLGSSGVAIRLVIKTRPGEQWSLARNIRGRIKQALDAAGIEIPFPQQSVWVRSMPGSEPESARSADATSTLAVRPDGTVEELGEETGGAGPVVAEPGDRPHAEQPSDRDRDR